MNITSCETSTSPTAHLIKNKFVSLLLCLLCIISCSVYYFFYNLMHLYWELRFVTLFRKEYDDDDDDDLFR